MEARVRKTQPRLPLKEIDDTNKKRIVELNGEFLNLYRVLGHHANLLSAWIEFAYTLRRDCKTARTLRELMILRGAQLEGSAYEWHQHRRWAFRPSRSRTSSSGANRRASAPRSVQRSR